MIRASSILDLDWPTLIPPYQNESSAIANGLFITAQPASPSAPTVLAIFFMFFIFVSKIIYRHSSSAAHYGAGTLTVLGDPFKAIVPAVIAPANIRPSIVAPAEEVAFLPATMVPEKVVPTPTVTS